MNMPNPYMPAKTGLELQDSDQLPTRPGAQELINLIDLQSAQKTADMLGRELDQAQSKIETAARILREVGEMQLTHAERNTINMLLIKLLEKQPLPAWEVGDIPF